jgi:hypothetical protein
MADLQSIYDKSLAALDEVNTVMGHPTLAAQLATLQGQINDLNAKAAALQTVINNVKAAVGV